MNQRRTLGLLIALTVFALDQLIKYFVIYSFDLREVGSYPIVPPLFQLTWVENFGVSLGLLDFNCRRPEDNLPDMIETCKRIRWGLVILTGAIATGVGAWLWRERNRQDVIGLGLVLGGALGNILDRVRFGHVVDYADLQIGPVRPFMVFNVADAAITIGVLILLFRAFLTRDAPKA